MKLVSVIIPTYNRAETLCNCVESVLKSTWKNMEIIIVDDCSTDKTGEMVQQYFGDNDKVSYIRLPEILWASGARNAGIKVAKGDYLIFVDDDNLVYPDMIELLVKEMEIDETIGLVAPLTINVNQGNICPADKCFNFFTARNIPVFDGERTVEKATEHRYSVYFSGNIFMVRRKIMDIVGEFDDTYRMMYEDSDFGYRIQNAGYSEYIVTNARTSHLVAACDGEDSRLRRLGIENIGRAYYFARNRSIFMKRHARWYHKLCYFTVVVHLYAIYYCTKAISCKRWDIAKAWLRGTWKGIFWREMDK